MSNRLNYFEHAPKAMTLLLQQEDLLQQQFSQNPLLSVSLLELVKLRASQINQCAFCIDMHFTVATQLGERIERLYGLSAWSDMPFYTEQEQLALAWTEQLTQGQSVSDELYERMVTTFGEEGMVHLTIAVNAINSWNRISKVFKPALGSYATD